MALLVGCTSTSSGVDDGPHPADDDGGTPIDPSNEPECPAPKSPTEHRDPITADEVWTAEGSPHLVTSTVRVRDGATLTIEPCAQVRFAAGNGLEIGFGGTQAALVAKGTAKRPITFAGIDGARWSSVFVYEHAIASFAHATLDGGGQEIGGGSLGAILKVSGQNEYPLVARLSVDTVTIRNALGPGVFLEGNSAFSPESKGLTITSSGSAEIPWPLLATPVTAGTIPPGSYTGNRRDELAVRGDSFDVGSDVVWSDRGVPYRAVGVPGRYIRVAGSVDASLTLEAGVTLRLDPGMFLWIGKDETTTSPSSGTLRTLGTAEKPVVLTSASDTPAAGDWQGIYFRGVGSSPNNRLEHTKIEYAGGDCGCAYDNCAPKEMTHAAAIHFAHVAPEQSFIRNSTISRSAGHGIQRAWVLKQTPSTTSFLDTNTFEEIAGCKETLYAEEANVCAERRCP